MSSPVDGELKTGSSSSNSAPRQRCVCVESLRPIASAARERLGTSSVVCRVCVWLCTKRVPLISVVCT